MDDNGKLNVIKNDLDSQEKNLNSEQTSKKLRIEIPDITVSLDDLESKINEIFDNDNLSILEKSKRLTEFKKHIKQEQDKINLLIDRVSEISPKKSKKFKTLSLDDLVTLFEKEEDINNKIKIYQNICYSINKFKSRIFDLEEEE